MAKPIPPTPTLRGKDAERLLRDLEDVCTPAQAERRIAYARKVRAEMMREGGEARTCEAPRWLISRSCHSRRLTRPTSGASLAATRTWTIALVSMHFG